MSEEIFRQKSLDKIKSPDDLDEYIRVSNPGIWLLLISIIILLIGACVWGFFGHIDSTVDTYVYVTDKVASCRIPAEDLTSVKVGMRVNTNDFSATITSVSSEDNQDCICTLSPDKDVVDGIYEGKIVIDSTRPLSFILN